MRLVAFLWILTHAVLTACAAMAIIVTSPQWSGDQAGLFGCIVALYWASIVWATAQVVRKVR